MQKDIKALLDKVSSGTANQEEEAIAKFWLHQLHQDDDAGLSEQELHAMSAEVWSGLVQQQEIPEARRRKLWPAITAAASIIIALSTALYFYTTRPVMQVKSGHSFTEDVVAGGNKAYLTLADGKKITLTGASNGTLATQAGIKISKTLDGQLVYTITDQKGSSRDSQYNSLETPRGGQYQLNLPDGTRVWLNAASSLKYPVNFSAGKERRVELNGEAYFEVAKDKTRPFIVKSAAQEIRVLGTHFDVNAYKDEASIRTTLLEGAVQVNNQVVLKPGQQSVLTGRQLDVKTVNAGDMIDWKNGEFIFDDEPLGSILKKVSRWYDVDIVYLRTEIGTPSFSGSISRFENVSRVLKMLEETSNVRFEIQGKTIKVK